VVLWWPGLSLAHTMCSVNYIDEALLDHQQDTKGLHMIKNDAKPVHN
jgi:hypothetical protein